MAKAKKSPVSKAKAPTAKDAPVDNFFTIRSMKRELEQEIRDFKDKMVAKYTDFNGHDLRRDGSWFFEQFGLGIHGDMEREKRIEKDRLIVEAGKAGLSK